MLEHLARFHQLEPDELGPDRDRLRRFAATRLDRPTFISLLDELLSSGTIAASGPWLHLPEHRLRPSRLRQFDNVLCGSAIKLLTNVAITVGRSRQYIDAAASGTKKLTATMDRSTTAHKPQP